MPKIWFVTNRLIELTETSPPQSHLEEHITTPHDRECTHPLHVLAVQCPMQTSPVTQPRLCYIHTTSVP